jgi:serine/threonine-protein kinase
MVLDETDGQWLAVSVLQHKCGDVDTELWATYRLQLRPDHTLSGEQSAVSQCSSQKAPVTFTRTGDVFPGATVADPSTEPPRVASPAQGLHGRYHQTVTYTNGSKPPELDLVVRTECLRTGDRCMSVFHNPNAMEALVFDRAKWTRDVEGDTACPAGGTAHIKVTEDYPLPQPPQDPITLLTGHGHIESTGTACTGGDVEEKLVRTGD